MKPIQPSFTMTPDLSDNITYTNITNVTTGLPSVIVILNCTGKNDSVLYNKCVNGGYCQYELMPGGGKTSYCKWVFCTSSCLRGLDLDLRWKLFLPIRAQTVPMEVLLPFDKVMPLTPSSELPECSNLSPPSPRTVFHCIREFVPNSLNASHPPCIN